jgi:hypothetical protein
MTFGLQVSDDMMGSMAERPPQLARDEAPKTPRASRRMPYEALKASVVAWRHDGDTV